MHSNGQVLLSKGASLVSCDDAGRSVLMHSVFVGDEEMVNRILEHDHQNLFKADSEVSRAHSLRSPFC